MDEMYEWTCVNENGLLRVLPRRQVAATISTLKLNFSPVRGSILMQLLFRLLESPEFILLAIELSLKSGRFLAMTRRGRYYIHVKTEISLPGSILMRFRLLEPSEFILLVIEFSL